MIGFFGLGHVASSPIARFEQLLSLLSVVVLSLWFAASVVHQFRFAAWQRLARIDILNLLPRWTFFAPNPGRTDFHIVFRDFAGDSPGEWRNFLSLPRPNRLRWLWNPDRFVAKAASDAIVALQAAASTKSMSERSVLFSGPYLAILTWVMAPRDKCAAVGKRQFAVVGTQGFGKERRLEVLFVSEAHRADA
jgi:hypothetical protein